MYKVAEIVQEGAVIRKNSIRRYATSFSMPYRDGFGVLIVGFVALGNRAGGVGDDPNRVRSGRQCPQRIVQNVRVGIGVQWGIGIPAWTRSVK
jgi:hypothetical protein